LWSDKAIIGLKIRYTNINRAINQYFSQKTGYLIKTAYFY